MKKTILLLLALLPSGCAWGPGGDNEWHGLIPDKDVDIINGQAHLNTPWGSKVIRWDRLSTRMNAGSTNPLPSLPAYPIEPLPTPSSSFPR